MTPLVHIDGRTVHATLRLAADVVIVGSGPAGATVAARLAVSGMRVLVLEEGHDHPPETFVESGVRAMSALYRDLGTSIALGDNPMPYLQGRAVGGTSVINGAICWEFPEEVHANWVAADPALGDALPLEALRAAEQQLSIRLEITGTDPTIAGRKARIMAEGADKLGLAHRPIRRNVVGCKGAGRCLQGCPHGAKLSMDRSLLPDAVRDGARIVSGVRVTRILTDAKGAYGVVGVSAGGAQVEVRASRVVLAASAIQTPVLLRRSGILHGPVGDGLSGHPGVSVTGRFKDPVQNHRGATQGHEITGLRHEGLKLETLGFDRSILGSRIPGVGRSSRAASQRSTTTRSRAPRSGPRAAVLSDPGFLRSGVDPDSRPLAPVYASPCLRTTSARPDARSADWARCSSPRAPRRSTQVWPASIPSSVTPPAWPRSTPTGPSIRRPTRCPSPTCSARRGWAPTLPPAWCDRTSGTTPSPGSGWPTRACSRPTWG